MRSLMDNGELTERSSTHSAAPSVLPNWSNPALYKTRLCDHFRLKGECNFGAKCWFAHGHQEMRQVPRLDRHPEAEVDSLAQVIRSLPPSRSRDAVNKGQQLTQQLLLSELLTQRPTTDCEEDETGQFSTSGLNHQHQAQIKPLLEQLRRFQGVDQIAKEELEEHAHKRTSSTEALTQQTVLPSPPPPVRPHNRQHSHADSLPDIIEVGADPEDDDSTCLPQANCCAELEMLSGDEESEADEQQEPPRFVEASTNTEPHVCFTPHPLAELPAAQFTASPASYRCFMECGGVPVPCDVLTYGFAYPI